MIAKPSASGLQPRGVVVLIAALLVASLSLTPTANAVCVCTGFAASGLASPCTQGSATPTVGTSCTSSGAVNLAFGPSSMYTGGIAANGPSRDDVDVAMVTGFTFQGTVTIIVDQCAPSTAEVPNQRRLGVNISGNVFAGTASIALQLINSCPTSTPTVVRNAVFHVMLSRNVMQQTGIGSTGGSTLGLVRAAGALAFGHWVTIRENTITVLATRTIAPATLAADVDTQVVGISLALLTIASGQTSAAASGGGADWSWPQALVEHNVLNLTTRVVNTTAAASMPAWRQWTSFSVVGIVAMATDIPPRARLQLLVNTMDLAMDADTFPQQLLAWHSTNTSSLTPPGKLSDATVGILWVHPSGSGNISLLASSVVEFNANVMRMTNRLGACYGIWQGVEPTAGATTGSGIPSVSTTPFVLIRADAKWHMYTNIISTPKPQLCRFIFALTVTDSISVASLDSGIGSGTFRVEFNHLVNVDKSTFLSGSGVLIGGPQLIVGFNSLVAFRSNRMYGFPLVDGNLTLPETLVGGVFSGISFLPYLLINGSTAPFANAYLPVTLAGDTSLFVMDSNIVFVIARTLQPTIIFRGALVLGAQSAVRITQNFLSTFSPEESTLLSVRNTTVMYGGINLVGAASVWVFARHVVRDAYFAGGVLGVYALGTTLPGTVTKCPTCRMWLGCSVSGLFSQDSYSNPGSLIEYVSPMTAYAAVLRATSYLPVVCQEACNLDTACFAPGTREAYGYLRNNYLPECSCRCGLGFSYSRQCGPPQGLSSGTITTSNGTFPLTVTESASLTKDETHSRSRTKDTRTDTVTISTSRTPSTTTSDTITETRSVTVTESMSQCYNYTSWETIVSWPFGQQNPNYFFGNVSYDAIHQDYLYVNLSLLPPARVGQHIQNWNRPNWNSPIFNFSYRPFDFHTPESAMALLDTQRIIGYMGAQFRVSPISTSKYEEVRFRWTFEVTNAVCPLRPYEFDVELKIDAVDVMLANATRDATAAAMFVAALHGNAHASALLARAPLITGIVACRGPMSAYENSVSMTFYRFGSVRGQYTRGAVVGNLIAVFAVVVFYCLALLFLAVITHVSSMPLALQNAVEALHIKSNYAGVALCTLQPTLAAGIALLRNPVDDGDDVLGGVAIGLCAVYVVFIACKLLLDTPDVVLVYDLIRPHQVPKSKLAKFVRHVFWAKYHFLPTNDLRRKIERMLLEEPPSSTEGEGNSKAIAGEGDVQSAPVNPDDASSPAADAAPAQQPQKAEEVEEDNEKLLGLLKMNAEEYAKSRRWERLHYGDVLIIPPPPEKNAKPQTLLDESAWVDAPPATSEAKPENLLDDILVDTESPEYTDVSRQVETEFSYEMMFNSYGRTQKDDDTVGIGIITEEERLKNLKEQKRGPMNLVELQRLQREEDIRKAKEDARNAREAKIAEIKAKIAAELAAKEAIELETKQKEEERVQVPLQVLELMRLAKPDKHHWHILIRWWSDPRYALAPHVTAVVLGVAHGFGDDYCRPATGLLLATFVVELVVLAATRLRVVVLPFHRIWYVIALAIGLASAVAMVVGQEADDNVALDVSSVVAFLFALVCLARVAVDAISTLVHMQVNAEKSMSLIARDQEILGDEEIELPYKPPPIPEKPPREEPVEPAAPPTPPRAPTPPPVALVEDDEEEWEDDPNRIFNPLGIELPKKESEHEDEEYTLE